LYNIFNFLYIHCTGKRTCAVFFYSKRDVNGKAFVSIKAKVSDGVKLFSAKKKTADDVFISSVEFDTTALKHITDSLGELGTVKTMADESTGGVEARFFSDSVEWKQPLNIKSTDSGIIKGNVTWLTKQGDSFPTGEQSFSVKVKAQTAKVQPAPADDSLWTNFWICLLTGLLAVLTPCVFPLVPVTVSFFLKRSKNRAEGLKNALWYSFSIIAIYTIPTLILTKIFGDKALYTISTHPVSNLLFFTIFIIFAISFFGAFDISLPNSWANKSDEKASKGGLTGIFLWLLRWSS
jgi:thiol:disulfide interchange protein DsbD